MPVRTGLFPWNISSFAPSEIPSREILLSNSKARADASCSIELILPMEICMPRTDPKNCCIPLSGAWHSSARLMTARFTNRSSRDTQGQPLPMDFQSFVLTYDYTGFPV